MVMYALVLVIVRKRQHQVSLITKQNTSATGGAQSVPIGIHTIYRYNLGPSVIDILSKNNGEHHILGFILLLSRLKKTQSWLYSYNIILPDEQKSTVEITKTIREIWLSAYNLKG